MFRDAHAHLMILGSMPATRNSGRFDQDISILESCVAGSVSVENNFIGGFFGDDE